MALWHYCCDQIVGQEDLPMYAVQREAVQMSAFCSFSLSAMRVLVSTCASASRCSCGRSTDEMRRVQSNNNKDSQ